jgi:hypothetical protein
MYGTSASSYTDPWSASNWAYEGTATVTLDLGGTASNVSYWVPPEPTEEVLDPKEERRRWHRALSRQAILAAQEALRGLRDDPSPRVSLQARRGLSGRQSVRKRVCAGSSRYRVLVN